MVQRIGRNGLGKHTVISEVVLHRKGRDITGMLRYEINGVGEEGEYVVRTNVSGESDVVVKNGDRITVPVQNGSRRYEVYLPEQEKL